MIDKEILSNYLRMIHLTDDSKSAREAIETLLKIYRNILHNEKCAKYRQIRPENPNFYQKVWCLEACRQFMFRSGWIEIPELLVFNSDENLIDVIELLLQYRDVTPSPSEWEENTKYEGKSEAQLREEDLKQKAAIERQKELDEFMKDKKYREELSRNIKAQIASDRKRIGPKFTAPVVGNKLVKGAKIRNLHSTSSSNKK